MEAIHERGEESSASAHCDKLDQRDEEGLALVLGRLGDDLRSGHR
jgi:hypothetical protein